MNIDDPKEFLSEISKIVDGRIGGLDLKIVSLEAKMEEQFRDQSFVTKELIHNLREEINTQLEVLTSDMQTVKKDIKQIKKRLDIHEEQIVLHKMAGVSSAAEEVLA